MKPLLLLLNLLMSTSAALAVTTPLVTVTPGGDTMRPALVADGVVEAVRQAVLAAQVPGAIVELRVKAGDAVRAGDIVARLDARAAREAVAASSAQVSMARAALEVAQRDHARQRQLLQQGFISKAAFDQAQAQLQSAEAAYQAQVAQSNAVRAQSDYHVIRAPFSGVISDLPVVQGDMAMPGRALATLVDPRELRVSATLPETAPLARDTNLAARARIELAGGVLLTPTRASVLPTADPGTHTVQVRLDLPAGLADIRPGQFARVLLPALRDGDAKRAAATLRVPLSALVRRAEFTGVYVVDASGKPGLRLVRAGRSAAGSVEILSGISPGDAIAVDHQAAARVR